jgi:L-lactate dehydrogenase complex protein LldG
VNGGSRVPAPGVCSQPPVGTGRFRADLHQVFEEARDARYLVFVTGPSRTTEIELTVTLGIHGPQHPHGWVL